MKLKICGMKYPDNIVSAAAFMPDYMGFIFYRDSPRFVGNDFVMPDIQEQIQKVGVFVNEDWEKILETCIRHGIMNVQLHGNESPEFCMELSQHVPIIKAFGVDAAFDFDQTAAYESYCQFFLFDTRTEGHGGGGKKFDHSLLGRYRGSLPYFISGGIGEEDMEGIISLGDERLYGIDLNSRFETEPGRKDTEKLKKVMSQYRER